MNGTPHNKRDINSIFHISTMCPENPKVHEQGAEYILCLLGVARMTKSVADVAPIPLGHGTGNIQSFEIRINSQCRSNK